MNECLCYYFRHLCVHIITGVRATLVSCVSRTSSFVQSCIFGVPGTAPATSAVATSAGLLGSCLRAVGSHSVAGVNGTQSITLSENDLSRQRLSASNIRRRNSRVLDTTYCTQRREP